MNGATPGVRSGLRIIINFHGIGSPWPGVPDDEAPYWCPASDWPGFADGLARLTERAEVAVEVTFDDGNTSDVELALPALVERDLSATFFACAGRVGQPHFLSAADLRTLRDAGMGIGSHGWAHTDLRKVGDEELVREAQGSRALLAEAVGEPVDRFAIPFGSYDRRVLRALRTYRTIYSSDAVRAHAGGWLVPRVSYTRSWTPDTMERLALASDPLVVRARRGLARTVKRLR